MDLTQLRNVIYLEEAPILQPASIRGRKIMMWDQYPALVFKVNHNTYRMAYEVQKEEHVKYLTDYKTDVYKVKGYMITLADGRELPGKTFIWNAERELLKEGSFDLKDWQMEQLEK
jgi:gamma-glutamyl AIG2-like cyclotransferase